ncbi:MAG: TonB-dependent receptor [Chitinophagaceae bacterium]|nr:MAG: TonB-dependent receptor [Chitinophagaceae bacterium]
MRSNQAAKYIFTICLFLLVTDVFGQRGVVRGFIYDEESDEPMIFTNILLEGTGKGATTDLNGFFTISGIEPGNYTLMSTYIGYDTIRLDIEVKADQMLTKQIRLRPSAIDLAGVEISAERESYRTEVKISTQKISTQNIRQLPSVGGEPDIAQFLQVLPGVITTGDQGGQIYIRGGSPVQTRFLLDGITVYNPFHSIGLFSIFETETVRNVDVMTGGFNAEYGGRISAIVDVRTRDGNSRRFSGLVSGSPFMTRAMLEGPIFRSEDGSSRSSFIVAGKHSYLDRVSPTLYGFIEEDGLPYSFTDVYGKARFGFGTGSSLSFSGFHNRDQANFGGITDFGWEATGIGTNFILVPGAANALITGHISYSDYFIEQTETDQQPRKSGISGINLNINFIYFQPDAELRYGIEFDGFQTDFEFFNESGIRFDQSTNNTELGGYVRYKANVNDWVIDPSLRIQYYGTLSDFSFEPRLGLKYNVSETFRLKAATGWYSQNLISTKSDRDVVDLFTGFLSAPDVNLVDTDGNTASHKLQKSFHLITGLEWDITRNIQFDFEPYYKRFNQLININRNKILPSDPDYTVETGDAYGLDFLVQYNRSSWFVWATYSLGWINRFDGEQEYPPHFDRRHNANIITAYTFGKNNNWELGLRWNLGSGFPFTKTAGFFEELSFADGLNTDYTGQNGNLGIIYSDSLNTGRLPYYHRMDISLKRTFDISRTVKMEVAGSVTNVYNRENIFYFDRVRYQRVNQFPILPSLSVSLSF